MAYTVTTPAGMVREYEAEEPALHHARLLADNGWSCKVTAGERVIFEHRQTSPEPQGIVFTDKP